MERLIHDLVAAKKQEGVERRDLGELRLSSGGRSKGARTDRSLEEVPEDDNREGKDFV